MEVNMTDQDKTKEQKNEETEKQIQTGNQGQVASTKGGPAPDGSGGEEPKKENKEEAPVKEASAEEVPVEEKPIEEPKEEKSKEEPEKTEEPTQTSAQKPKEEPTGKFKDLIKEIESLSVADLAELVKALEERFGVSAASVAPPSGAVSGAVQGAGGEAVPGAEEKATYTVVLASAGDKKIDAIKVVREVNPDLGLKEAKDLVEGTPATLKENVKKEEAEEIKKKFETIGAKVELK